MPAILSAKCRQGHFFHSVARDLVLSFCREAANCCRTAAKTPVLSEEDKKKKIEKRSKS